MNAAAVKQCLEHLTKTHDRAPSDLMLDEIMADGQVLTLKTKVPRPALLNYLCDPYGCIIDVDAGFDGGIVAGTGPYIAVDCESGDHLNLIKNESYWGGMPHIDELTIRTISDGNTLSAALQSGDIDAAYGMAYEAYPLFRNDNYQFSQIATSRAFICWMNYESPFASDPAVRKAIAMGIDKEGFVSTLLDSNSEVAKGPPKPFCGQHWLLPRTVGHKLEPRCNLCNRTEKQRCVPALPKSRLGSGSCYRHNQLKDYTLIRFYAIRPFFRQGLLRDFHIPSAGIHRLSLHRGGIRKLRKDG